MPAAIKFDAYDYQRYGTLAGKVVFISPDSNVSDEKSTAKGAVYLVRLDVTDGVAKQTLRQEAAFEISAGVTP